MTPLETLPESRAVSPGRFDEEEQTPEIEKRPAGPTQSISNFMLDARAAPSPRKSTFAPSITSSSSSVSSTASYKATEDAEVARLLHETRLWRLANTAQWVAWGVVQATVPGMPSSSPDPSMGLDGTDEHSDTATITGAASPDPMPAAINNEASTAAAAGQGGEGEGSQQALPVAQKEPDEASEEEAEFDYLAYARDRAMFFWGDAVGLGLVRLEELPEDVRRDIKIVDY